VRAACCVVPYAVWAQRERSVAKGEFAEKICSARGAVGGAPGRFGTRQSAVATFERQQTIASRAQRRMKALRVSTREETPATAAQTASAVGRGEAPSDAAKHASAAFTLSFSACGVIKSKRCLRGLTVEPAEQSKRAAKRAEARVISCGAERRDKMMHGASTAMRAKHVLPACASGDGAVCAMRVHARCLRCLF